MVQPIPEGYQRLTPYLTIKGAGKAIDWYKDVFGAKERMRMPGPGGAVMHAELEIGDSVLMLSDEMPGGASAPEGKPMPGFQVMIYVENSDAVTEKAIKGGATVVRPIETHFYGDRTSTVNDPFGHQWTIGTHVEDVSGEEMGRRMQAMMGGQQ